MTTTITNAETGTVCAVSGSIPSSARRWPTGVAKACARIGAGQNADQRDADLHRRQEPARLGGQVERISGARGAGLDHRLQPRLARRDDRQLAHRQHPVQRDQREDQDQVEPGEGKERVAHNRFRFIADKFACPQAERQLAGIRNRSMTVPFRTATVSRLEFIDAPHCHYRRRLFRNATDRGLHHRPLYRAANRQPDRGRHSSAARSAAICSATWSAATMTATPRSSARASARSPAARSATIWTSRRRSFAARPRGPGST